MLYTSLSGALDVPLLGFLRVHLLELLPQSYLLFENLLGLFVLA